MSHDGVRLRPVLRAAAFLTAGVLTVPCLAGCSSDEKPGPPAAAQDIASTARDRIADGGTLRWAADSVPQTLNAFQADADDTTSRVVGAVLPTMFRLDSNGQPQRDTDYLRSAKVVETKPKQVVRYQLSQQAVWSDGREIGAADFAAQWRALSGRNSAYWTARNAGYDRIEKIERGGNDLEVQVTFSKPYADWRSLFSPLYPKEVMSSPDAFNDGARRQLKLAAGPFALDKVDTDAGQVVLKRNPRWWGTPAKLDKIVLSSVSGDKRMAALRAGRIDLADVSAQQAGRISEAARAGGPAGTPAPGRGSASGAPGSQRSGAAGEGEDHRTEARAHPRQMKPLTEEQKDLRRYNLRKSLEPAYTQLALNGSEGPLSDERVRRAVARALDRHDLARLVLSPLGLPARPVGSHLALAGQQAYADGSGALGKQDTKEAQALLTDAGWVHGGPATADKQNSAEKKAGEKDEKKAGNAAGGEADGGKADHKKADEEKADQKKAEKRDEKKDEKQDDGGDDGKNRQQHLDRGGMPGAYAPEGTAAPHSGSPSKDAAAHPGTSAGVLAKNGKPLTLRFVLPSGPGSESLRTVGDRISRMLTKIGIRTEIAKVADDSYFKDHVAAGDYDMALYSWPASAYPATDGRPIFAKPVPAADGSLNVEQNYTRVGTDHIDQIFDQALTELDPKKERDLVRKADTRIWAEAGSIPLYQRPQLVAAKGNLVNAGAWGFQSPDYADMGFLKSGARPGPAPSTSTSPAATSSPSGASGPSRAPSPSASAPSAKPSAKPSDQASGESEEGGDEED
ncbi:ABC transporter substrate-binding protein [Streptomyces sp. NPDC058045]|uniref:ABC transporter substrate-binding protein n=1 Tax=Streptomyces sp. NPDC058045 TaxID=3346311 RepID=UPI0036EA82F0